MNKNDKIYIAGHTGLVGSALIRKLNSDGYNNLLVRTSSELDLTIQADVEKFFAKEKPDYVFLAAAKVGGILANNTYPADFIYKNLAIQNNVIHSAWKFNVKRLLFLGSSCIYPKNCPQPMKEEHLLSGYLEPTNEPYAIAKIAGIKMCESYNRQYETQFIPVMATNLYGSSDNFDLETSHVLPALIRKFHEAKENGVPEVVVWGTGRPRREFLFVDDLSDACVFVMNLDESIVKSFLIDYPKPCFLNIGAGEDISIADLARLVAKSIDYRGNIIFDSTKPDGTMRKLLISEKINKLGWKSKMTLKHGISLVYQNYKNGLYN